MNAAAETTGSGAMRLVRLSTMLAPLLLTLPASCGPAHERGEAWSQYYGTPADETSKELAERKKIMHWVRDPRTRERVGFLERYRVRLKGSREWRDMYYILNAGGTEKLGFINEYGGLFKYDAKGHLVRLGEYPVIDTGIKVFFGFPRTDQVGFEDIDPYKD